MELDPSLKKPHPADLLTLAVEVRLDIYAHVFGNSVAMMTNDMFNLRRADPMALGSRVATDKNRDQIYRRQRSSQILRVCGKIYHEALPVLYANTTFYIHAGAHLVSLHRLVNWNNVRTVILRMEVENSLDFLKDDVEMLRLRLEGVVFPRLTSLQIFISKIDVEPTFDARFLRVHTLFSILRVQLSHHQLCLFFEREPRQESEIAFRLVTASAKSHEKVRGLNVWPNFALSDLR